MKNTTCSAILLLLTLKLWAQTSGPTTPEVQSFTPHDMTKMVNTFTGDFTYNILLMDIGGFPLNLSYNSGSSPNDEAGFVGLGWNLNIGAINRTVRGLPDDFNGDVVSREFHIAPETVAGGSVGVGLQLFGFSLGDNAKGIAGLGISVGLKKSTKKGFGLELSLSPSASVNGLAGDAKLGASLSPTFGVSSDKGPYLDAGASFSGSISANNLHVQSGISPGISINSREGLESINFGVSQLYGQNNPSMFPLFSAASTYTPNADFPIQSNSISGSVKIGGEIFGTHISGSFKGFWSNQYLAADGDQKPAFGYLFLQNALDGNAYMDFNREKDGPYMKENPNLPVTNLTYDIYSVSGHGISGQFRPFRGEIGTIADPTVQNSSLGGSAGFELGLGQTFQAGVDLTRIKSNGVTGKWIEDNELVDQLLFRGETDSFAYEPVYFKNVGELTITENEALFNRFGGFNPICAKVNGDGKGLNSIQIDSAGSNNVFSLNDNNYKTQREPRNVLFSYLSAAEAEVAGLEKKRYNYRAYPALDANRNLLREEIRRVDESIKSHHLSEITITRDDGARFVYGLPAYNYEKKEVSFSIAGSPDESTGLISYTPGNENSIGNRVGGESGDQYFSSTTTPAYAYAYLITAILSDDYVDVTGDGPSSDDLGTYTKFNYTRVHERYKWRIPIQQNMAFFDGGMENNPDDDKAHYTYGEKEIWYIHSIETKNYMAFFSLSNRDDALGILDENGGKDEGQRLKKLDLINLYSKAAWIENPANAIPIQRVYFQFANNTDGLCRRAPNTLDANGGKLTLNKLRFKNADSYRDYHSPYSFEYSSDYNFPYNIKAIDRWGNYKADNLNDISNERFPYTNPNSTLSNSFAAAWHLTSIDLPSGGKIKIDYEADDYAFVQDRVAMEMRQIVGSAIDSLSDSLSTLFNTRYLFFKLKRPTRSREELEAYFHGIEQLYFNFKVQVPSNHSTKYETVSGFIPFENMNYQEHFGFRTRENTIVSDGYTEAWIKLPSINKEDSDNIDPNGVNPISKATWQTVRKYLPWLAYCDNLNNCRPAVDNILVEIANLANQVATVTTGQNAHDRLRERQVGNQFNKTESFLRLNSPNKRKVGGGSRVRRLTIEDNWGLMQAPISPEQNYTYIQEFNYTTIDENSQEVSSGVASYEPLVGGDENPFVLPHRYQVNKFLALGLSYYHLEPFGESFFPGPVVGYSKVITYNTRREGVERTATGFTQDEYFTSKDFPTKVRYSNIQHEWKEVPLPPFIHEKFATVSQGYVIELNDMHGKPKANRVFQETDPVTPISSVEYFYKTQTNSPGTLDNTILVLNESSGKVEPRMVGVEYDIVFDARDISNKTESIGVQFNTDGFFIGPILVPFPIPFPDYSRSVNRYRGMVATKVIQRVGIIDSVVVTDMGSRIATKNLVYNGKTGMPIITKSPDEYHTDIYTTNFPNTWNRNYDGMGPAYRNIGISQDSVRFGSLPNANRYFIRGDELLVKRLDTIRITFPIFNFDIKYVIPPFKAWVYEVGNNNIRVIDETGKLVSQGLYRYKIIRSGRRNMQNASIGQVITLNSPVSLNAADNTRRLQFSNILDAAALTYSENWQTYKAFSYPAERTECECVPVRSNIDTIINELNQANISQSTNFIFGFPIPINSNYRTYYQGSKLRIEKLNPRRDAVVCVTEVWTADGTPFPQNRQFVPTRNVLVQSCDDNQALQLVIDSGADGQPGLPGPTLPTPFLYLKTNCRVLFDCNPSKLTIPGGPITCNILDGARVNPFVNNILNNWRPTATYKYVTDRSAQGSYNTFANYWGNLKFSLSPGANPGAWQRADQAVMVDSYGKTLESRDALNRYSGTQYGYNYNLPVATAVNARYNEMGFEGFEDNAYVNFRKDNNQVCPPLAHFKFTPSGTVQVAEEQSHTGRYSLKIGNGASAYIDARTRQPVNPGSSLSLSSPEYRIPRNTLIPPFAPLGETAKQFVISAWVKVIAPNQSADNMVSYTSPSIRINVDQNILNTFRPSGPIIDGWQQISGTFTLPGFEGIRGVSIHLNANNANNTYFDDVRVHPFNSVFKSYVFDPLNLRLQAELDENNFATFYEYDQEGNLMRTKKETERGIVTLQEVQASKPKKQ